MHGVRPSLNVCLSDTDRVALEALSRRRVAQHREVIRARALLMAAEGRRNVDIAEAVDVDARTVSIWRKDFQERGTKCLLDRQRPGRPSPFSPAVKATVVHLVCQKPGNDIILPDGIIATPTTVVAQEALLLETESVAGTREGHVAVVPASDSPQACPAVLAGLALIPAPIRQFIRFDPERQHWVLCVPVSRFCARILAWILVTLNVAQSISRQTVARWLRNDKLKPWRFRTWITPKDLASFLPRACEVLDLYSRIGQFAPHEVALSIDEKTSIQARQHATYKPTGAGEPAHVENTYARRGAVGLIAGLDVASGKVYGEIHDTRGFKAFSHFLKNQIDKVVALGRRTIHLILDNGSAHRPKYLGTWLEETYSKVTHPDLTISVHWLPVRSSWLNQIEIFFSFLQTQALTPNDFPSTAAVAARVLGFIELYNVLYPPFKWTYTSTDLRKKHGVSADAKVVPTDPEHGSEALASQS